MKKHQYLLIIFILLVLTILLHSHYLIYLDESVVLNGAWKIYNGENIYQDFFEYIAPLTFYLNFFLFKIFSPSYLVARIAAMLLVFISALLVFHIYRRLSSNNVMAILGAVVWLFLGIVYPVINHNVYSSVIVIGVVYLFVLFWQSNRVWLLYWCGLGSALSFYFFQPKGVAIILAISSGIILFRQKNKIARYFSYFLIGLLSIFVPGILIWGQAVFINPLVIAGSYWQVNRINYLVFFLFVVLFIFSYIWSRKIDEKPKIINFLFLLQGLLFLSILNRPDVNHLLINIFPSITILFWMLEKYLKSLRAVNYLVAFIVFIIFFSSSMLLVYNAYRTQDIQLVITDLRREIGDNKIYAGPFLPYAYFELNQPNPYYTSVIETVQGDVTMLDKNYNILMQEQPQYAIINYDVVEHLNYQKNKIDDYIWKNFKTVKTYGDTLLLKRNN